MWTAILDIFLALIGLQRKPTIDDVYKKDSEIAEKQAQTLSTPIDVSERLRDGTF